MEGAVGLQIRVFLPDGWKQDPSTGFRVYRPSYASPAGILRFQARPPLQHPANVNPVGAATVLLSELQAGMPGLVVEKQEGTGEGGVWVRMLRRYPGQGVVAVWCVTSPVGTIIATLDPGNSATAERELADAQAIVESAHLAEISLVGMHSDAGGFAQFVEQTPNTLELDMPMVEGWEDVSDYGNADAPYRFRRTDGTSTFLVWCCWNSPGRVPCGSETELLEWLRGVCEARGSIAYSTCGGARFGPMAVVVYVADDRSVHGVVCLARSGAYIYSHMERREQRDRANVLAEHLSMMSEARVADPSAGE